VAVFRAALFFAASGAVFLAAFGADVLVAFGVVAFGLAVFGVVAATMRPAKSRWLVRICWAKSKLESMTSVAAGNCLVNLA
jgi:hypothetical protein